MCSVSIKRVEKYQCYMQYVAQFLLDICCWSDGIELIFKISAPVSFILNTTKLLNLWCVQKYYFCQIKLNFPEVLHTHRAGSAIDEYGRIS